MANDVAPVSSTRPAHVYEIRPRKDQRGVNLISDALPFGRLWYAETNGAANAVSYAKFRSRSHDAVIRVYDQAGNVIETHRHAGDFKEWVTVLYRRSPLQSADYGVQPDVGAPLLQVFDQ
jgi:hypothetical protein